LNQPSYGILAVVIPLLTAFTMPLIGFWKKRFCYYIANAALFAALFFSIRGMVFVLEWGPLDYHLGGWTPPWGIAFHIDALNAFMGTLTASLFCLAGIASNQSVPMEMPLKEAPFYALFLLLFTGLMGMLFTGDVFNLYVFLEIGSLTAYALIAMGEPGALMASLRYLILGTVGASWYLLGVGYLYIATGSLNMADLSGILPGLGASRTILSGFTFLLFGIAIKMALFPVHIWLPEAYAKAPSIVSTAVAPIMTKVMAYILIRILFSVFHADDILKNLKISGFMSWIGTIAVLFGGITALAQTDFKKMLGFIIVAEIGYIVGGIGIANTVSLKGAIFHMLNDAVMMASLFLVAMMVTHRTGGHGIERFRGLFRKTPLTAVVFTVGALAVIGVPPTCSFFSKWYLLLGGIEAGHWGFVAALLICTLINVALFFRIFDTGIALHGKDSDEDLEPAAAEGENRKIPWSMLVPGLILAAAILVIGIGNQWILTNLIQPALPKGF